MKLLLLCLNQIKKNIKNVKSLMLMFVMPFVVITFISVITSGGSSNTASSFSNVVVNINDNGKMAEELTSDIKFSAVYYGLSDKAMASLKSNDVVAVYEIPSDFTASLQAGKKPQVSVKLLKEGSGTDYYNSRIEAFIDSKLKESIYKASNIDYSKMKENIPVIKQEAKSEGIKTNQIFVLIFIMNFIFFSSNGVSSEIIEMKKQRVLQRAITTPNKEWQIVWSIYIGQVAAMFISYSVITVLQMFINKIAFSNLPVILLNVFLMSCISLAFGLAVLRISEKENIASLINNLVGTVFCFVAIAGVTNELTSSLVIKNFAKFTPNYWAISSILDGSFVKSSIILILTVVVLFTAGTFNSKKVLISK